MNKPSHSVSSASTSVRDCAYLRRRQQHYLWMFIEDLSMRVVPSSIDRDEYEARLVLEPSNEATEQMIARGFSVSGDHG